MNMKKIKTFSRLRYIVTGALLLGVLPEVGVVTDLRSMAEMLKSNFNKLPSSSANVSPLHAGKSPLMGLGGVGVPTSLVPNTPQTQPIPASWQASVQHSIAQQEYEISWQPEKAAYASPNRTQNLRFQYQKNGFSVTPRDSASWSVNMELVAFGKGILQDFEGQSLEVNKNKAESKGTNLSITYENQLGGMRQNFIVHEKPHGDKNLTLAFAAESSLAFDTDTDKDGLTFYENGQPVYYYNGLHVTDANGQVLEASIQKTEAGFLIDVRDENAAYPVLVDPLSTTPNWLNQADQASAKYGTSVAPAGDINNDGYADVIVGVPFYDNGQTDEGRVFGYYGSSSGLPLPSSWSVESNQAAAEFGTSLTAGDFNGDGNIDVAIGAPQYDAGAGPTKEGGVFIFLNSGSGLPSTPSSTLSGDANSNFGYAVASCNVNSDAYDDLLVGAYLNSQPQSLEGRLYVFHGTGTGIPINIPNSQHETDVANDYFAYSISSAGDVNNDGYDDVIIGTFASNGTGLGSAYVFHGSSAGLSASPSWSITSAQTADKFGSSVSAAGDVNGDGYDDVIVGAYGFDNGQTDEGRAYVYHGSASGLNTSPNWTVESNQASAQFGISVSNAGDVNADGYSDVMVGANLYDNGQTDEGSAFIYPGSAAGLSTSPFWTGESNSASAQFGFSVASAGDVNNDGLMDVIVGAPNYTNGQANEGGTYAYYGYQPAPTISTISPTSGPAGTLVTITGTNLSNLTNFQIAGAQALAISNTGTSLVGFVMPGATTGTVDVTTAGGSISSGQTFTLTSPSATSASQIGSDIDGESPFGQSGTSVSLSADGQYVAIGAPFNSSEGSVRVYKNNAGTWTQFGGDIDGGVGDDVFGQSVSISADGQTVAIGDPLSDGGGSNDGSVRVYKNNAGTWTQVGGDIDGESSADQNGTSVSLSADGQTVAIGAIGNGGAGPTAGHVRIYKNNAGTWTQIGVDIDGEAGGDQSGYSVSLSADGQTVAIGAPFNADAGSDAGHVRVYKNIAGTWTKIGADINGENGGDQFGFSVSLSADGLTVAIGAHFNPGGLAKGHVRVYKFNAGVWSQLGANIDGEVFGDESGFSVSLSADGKTVAIGAPNNDGSTAGAGQVRLYKFNSPNWTQIGSDIDGETPNTNDNSGYSVSLSVDGQMVAIGAPYNDGGGTSTGHVRVYEFIGGIFTNQTATKLVGASTVPSGTTTFADYDYDGDMDLLIAGDNNAELWRNNGSGTFSNVTASAITTPLGYSIDARLNSESAWGDFDGDGDLDLLYGGDEEFNTTNQRSWLLRNDGGTFSDATPAGFPGIQDGTFNWVDFDNDGDLDIALNGFTGSFIVTELWRNDGGTFTITTSIPTTIRLGKMRWTDFDNDGDQDFLLAGTDAAGNARLQVWRNGTTGALGLFVIHAAFEPGLNSFGSPANASWGDFDGDSDQDFVVSWFNGSGTFTQIYQNTAGVFTDVTATVAPGLPQVIEGTVSWIDYDNDGDIDLMLTGVDDFSVSYTQLWRNSAGVFSYDASALSSIAGLQQTTVAWADVDNDADLDFVISGYDGISLATQLWINGISTGNNAPSTPASLSAVPSGSNVTLTWAAASDGTTPASQLTYNIRIGTASNAIDVVAPNADVSSGFRWISAPGNMGIGTTASIYDLVPGTYYWSVQAIDNGFVGSAFATEGTFTIGGPPTISSFTPTLGPVGTSVTIMGTNFNTTPANNVVYFGATKATVSTASATSLTVTVPAGATYAPVTVFNTATNLVAYSTGNFTPTFTPGNGSLTADDFEPNLDFGTDSNPYFLALGDLDGDGKTDLAIANDVGTVSVLRNTGSTGAVSYATNVNFTTATGSTSVAIGDIDGDGKQDLIVSNNIGTISILRNTGSPGVVSFATNVDFAAGANPQTVAIGDVDGDGKVDLAVTNQGSNTVSVFRNTSTPGAVNFESSVNFAAATDPVFIAMGDLDGDGKVDLAIANFAIDQVSVLRNLSSLGTVNFAASVNFTTGNNPHAVAIGDLDGDGKADMTVTNTGDNDISVLRNLSTPGSLVFAGKVDFPTDIYPYSIGIGDLDGDGMTDLAIANASSSTVSLLRNTSTPGLISLNPKVDVATNPDPYSIAVGDSDGDGLPDLAVVSYTGSTVSIMRNNPAVAQFSGSISGSGNEFATATAVDASGNIYTTGYFTGTIDADPGAGVVFLASNGGNDIFITKFNSSGTLLWAGSIGSTGDDKAFDIKTDPGGDIAITGIFSGIVDFDFNSGVLNGSSAGTDQFLAKYNSSGDFQWVDGFSCSGPQVATALAIDNAYNIYVTGTYSGSINFSGTVVTSVGGSDIFVYKTLSNGAVVWAQSFGGSENDAVNAIAASAASADVAITGSFSGAAPLIGISTGLGDPFITNLNSTTGAHEFTVPLSMAVNTWGRGWDLTYDAAGSIIAVGEFAGSGSFGFSNGGYDAWAIKIDNIGNIVWTKTFGGTGNDMAFGVAVSGTDIYITGTFSGTADFNPDGGVATQTSAGSYDVFLNKLDTSGSFISASKAGGTGYDSGQSISINGSNPYVSGYFNGSGDFDPGAGTITLIPQGGYDALVMCFCN